LSVLKICASAQALRHLASDSRTLYRSGRIAGAYSSGALREIDI
jgi:hypothetical protein